MTLTSILTYLHKVILLSVSTNFQVTGFNISEKSTVLIFSYRKAQVSKFDFAVNRSRSPQGHHSKKL